MYSPRSPEPYFVPTGEHPLWDEALAAVNRDLAATLPEQRPLCLVSYSTHDAEQVFVALANGEAHGDSLPPVTSAERALGDVADAAQETVMECLWKVWPVCTEHGLGMHVAPDSGRPSWWCAGGGHPGEPAHAPAAVGELEPVPGPRQSKRERRKGRTARRKG
ncbi:hypothetical protein JK359_12945 [Streptomyces actinomycinicus]|uniref:Uncharacterized protein n=1 Tax=Streptomyces actinomycinicus TaxID=1695166 RepID=A0A937EGY0_9ACTN|nr:hypothetical protein [Streptomyces actinomycinicus]MBL1082878.1 hypothetical protein [Streptomyces actinomycinicus]